MKATMSVRLCIGSKWKTAEKDLGDIPFIPPKGMRFQVGPFVFDEITGWSWNQDHHLLNIHAEEEFPTEQERSNYIARIQDYGWVVK